METNKHGEREVIDMKAYNISWIDLMHKLRERFGDDNLFLTFLVSHTKNDIRGKRLQVSTFAKDNIEKMDGWMLLMHAKLLSESVDTISLVVRVFLPEKIGKIPKKEIYHFLIFYNKVIAFNREETTENQNTDTNGKLLIDEPSVICKSSEDLIETLFSTSTTVSAT